MIGLCTTPQKKLTMKSRIVSCCVRIVMNGAASAPIAAPLVRLGSKSPPGMPLTSVRKLAAACVGRNHHGSDSPCISTCFASG